MIVVALQMEDLLVRQIVHQGLRAVLLVEALVVAAVGATKIIIVEKIL